MFFKKTRENMMDKKERQNWKLLDDTLMPGEDLKLSITTLMPHGILKRSMLAVTDKRLIIIQIDKSSHGFATSLKFDDIVSLSKYEVLKQVSINIATANNTYSLAPFVKGDADKMIYLIEGNRF